jgi:hypothetical protein
VHQTRDASLAAAGDLVRKGRPKMTGLSPRALPAHYTRFTADTMQASDAASSTDIRLRGQVQDAAGADRSGRASSGAVVNGAVTDAASLTPARPQRRGQRALIAALRSRQ